MVSPAALLHGAYYHIYNRGTNRENIFFEERNYDYFFQLYAKHIEPVAETYAYCLLRNHFHLLVRIKSEEEIHRVPETLRVPEPSKNFSNFFNAYAKAINKAYGRTGSLFQHPFGRVIITNDRQFYRVIAYIHQNPQKHKFVEDFREWKYSSYAAMLSEKPSQLTRTVVLDWFGGAQQYLERHSEWVNEAHCRWFVKDDLD